MAEGRATPLRTCVGCRVRAAKEGLLRVVAVGGVLTPDPRGRLPGRGAYLHLDLVCLDLAERRRALTRALRVAGPLDSSPVRALVGGRRGGVDDGGVDDERDQGGSMKR